MVKHVLLATVVAAAASVCAQETTTAPALSEMAGDYIVLNWKEENGVKSLAEMKPFTIEVTENGSLLCKSFYMIQGEDFEAEYSETNGMISIPAGTPIFNMDPNIYAFYPWNDETEEIIMRPIEYKYVGYDSWTCNATIMMVAIQDDVIDPRIFSKGSQISRCNATSNNISYTIDPDDRSNILEFRESRPAYVTISGNTINAYNVLQISQYGYGVLLSGTIDREKGEVWFRYTLTGQANDGTYRILTSCEYNEETNLPTGVAHTDNNYYGMIHATIDLEKGEIAFEPMAIWAAVYDPTTGTVAVDEDLLLYEFIKTVTVTYDVDKTVSSIEDTPNIDNQNKEVSHIDYYAIDGRKLIEPQEGSLVIKVTVYTDKSTQVEKIVYLKH